MSDDRTNDRTQAEIERDIERTRSNLAQTIDALERKLDVRHLVAKGMDMFSNRFLDSEALNRGVDAVRANPVPVALIGIGAAWLIANNTGVVDRLANDERVESARRRVSDLADTVSERAGEMASSVASTVGFGGNTNTDQPLGHTGNAIVDRSGKDDSGWMHQVTGMAQDGLRSARDAMEGPVSYATDGATKLADRVSGALDKHPLAVGAAGVMAGMLLAALLPMTKTETELLGESSNQLWQKARDAGEDAVTRVRQTATEAATKVATQVATQVAQQAIEAVGGESKDSAKSDQGANKPA